MIKESFNNIILLRGTVCQQKIIGKMLTFSMCFPNGKDENGNYRNGFVECRYLGEDKENFPLDKSKIKIRGWLRDNIWEKNGKTYHNMVVCFKDYKIQSDAEETNEVSMVSGSTNSFDDTLPW